jgi:hypothetical protein
MKPIRPKGAVQGDEAPQTTDLAPAHEVALGLRSPQQQQGVSQAVGGGGNGYGQKVSAFQVAGGKPWVYQEVTKVVPVSQPPTAM